MTTTPTPEQRWRRFAAALHQADRAGDVPLDGLQIADLLWMAKRLSASLSAEQQQSPTSTDPGGAGENPPQPTTPDPRRHISPDPTAGSDGTTKTTAATAMAGDHDPKADVDPMVSTEASAADRLRLAVAEPGLLPQRRRLGRALAPLNRWVYTGPARDLDVPATVEEIARARAERRPWRPVLRPRRQAWLALHLVFDGHTSMVVWERLQRELPRCLSQQVRWRDLRCWTLSRNPSGSMELRGANGRPRPPRQLKRPGGRDLVVLVSDQLATSWRDGSMAAVLHDWAEVQPVVLLQVLPPRLWRRTGLTAAEGGWVQARHALQHHAHLRWQALEERPSWREDPAAAGAPANVTLPLTTLEPDDLAAMAGLLTAAGGNSLRGFRFALPTEPPAPSPQAAPAAPPAPPNAEQIEDLLGVFLFTASLEARRLLALLTYAPIITLPVVRVVRNLQRGSGGGPAVIAEVLFSGLIRNMAPAGTTTVPIDQQQLCFVDELHRGDLREGLRERLREGLLVGEAREVFRAVEQHVAQSLGLSVETFEACLCDPNAIPPSGEQLPESGRNILRAFARVSTRFLRGLGPDYARLADAIEKGAPGGSRERFTLGYETAQLEEIALQPIKFITSVLTEQSKQGLFPLGKKQGRWIRQDQNNQAWGLIEPRGLRRLTMIHIPAGSFEMGSPSEEVDRCDDEGPQHTVTLQEFLMSQSPITQAQWREVAEWQPRQGEKWGCTLEPDPSNFKSSYLPVERVSWFDAMEFCNRLSQRTGRFYTLPSEAQWEYACRAGTTTPFHFGATITPELANYDGNYTYTNGPKGEYRKKTTYASSLPANAWGLYDMHGNVREWCLDHWHASYEGAPSDGSAWLDPVKSEEQDKKKRRPLRGGSWNNYPWDCRSAFRGRNEPDDASFSVGFRVVCLPQGRSS